MWREEEEEEEEGEVYANAPMTMASINTDSVINRNNEVRKEEEEDDDPATEAVCFFERPIVKE